MKSFRMMSILLLAAAPLAAQPASNAPREAALLDTVSVSGTAHVRTQPDRFSFTVGVQTQAPAVEEAVTDPARGRDQGLRAAFEDARAKAALLAAAAGRTLGPALAITEGTAPNVMPRPIAMQAMAMKAAVSEVPVESGSEELTFAVSVVFALR